MVRAEIQNCPKCVTISFSAEVFREVHTMKCPNEECGHKWNFIPYDGE